MNKQRIEKMKDMMDKGNYDVLICRLPENVLFLSGYWPLCGCVFLVFPLAGKPICILPNAEEKEARAALWEAESITYTSGTIDAGNQFEEIRKCLKQLSYKKGWRRVGYEGDFESIAPAWNAAELYIPAETTKDILNDVFGPEKLSDITDLLYAQRSCKTEYEIHKLRIVNEISNFGLKTFFETVAPGVSGIELVAAVESSIMVQGTGYKGTGRVRAFAQVAVGAQETAVAYRLMGISTRRKLAALEIALLELAVVADGYWCDRTRARVAGEPTTLQKKVYEIVERAQERAIDKVAPGIKAADVDEATRAVIREAGFEGGFVHITGHGLGFRYHEPYPLIGPSSKDVLREGMVHTVEPGIYSKEIGGLRIEDDILVTETSCEVLGAFPKEI